MNEPRSVSEDEQPEKRYTFKWQHGPAPGLTFYSGEEVAFGPDIQTAMRRAKRMICQRGCFKPANITIKSVEFQEEFI